MVGMQFVVAKAIVAYLCGQVVSQIELATYITEQCMETYHV